MNKQMTLPKNESAGRYACVRSSLNSFDIINTEHKDWFWRWIGHTAVAYKDFHTGVIYVYESTTLNKFTGVSGVQLTPMRVWLRNYPGKVLVRRVILNSDFEPAGIDSRGTASQHIKKYRGTPYPDLKDIKQKMFVANAAIDLPFGIGENPDRSDIFFCTHLVADFWRWRGYYIGEEPPSEFEPDDMRPGGKFERMLVKGVELGDEVRLK